MAIELFLSSDGKHTVHVCADDAEQMDKLAPYAKALYEKVLQQYGTKPQLWENARNGKANGQAQFGQRVDTPQQAQAAVAPQCPVHGVPMKYRQGKRGPFWSCAIKENGQWCNQTQQVEQSANGQGTVHASI